MYPSITKPDLYIDVTSVKSLLSESLNTNQLTIGANKTLNDTITLFTNTAKSVPQFSYLQKLADHIMKIAHTSVRNVSLNFYKTLKLEKYVYFTYIILDWHISG